jgi:hypothetical protein
MQLRQSAKRFPAVAAYTAGGSLWINVRTFVYKIRIRLVDCKCKNRAENKNKGLNSDKSFYIRRL